MRELTILVLGYARPDLLQVVLESLGRQRALDSTEVWIDGTADRMELKANTARCAEVAEAFPVADIRRHSGHMGIEKLMLDALNHACQISKEIVVIEDDCFPNRDAVAVFRHCLAEEASNPNLFSIYGHPFLVPKEEVYFPRFQGWGWATTRTRLLPILDEARRLFLLPERDYLDFTRQALTDEVVKKLDMTPGRDVCQVLRKFYSWDSCTALLCAQRGLEHRKTPHRVIFNCGLGGDSGHFPESDHLRRPPFNMISPKEVWNHF